MQTSCGVGPKDNKEDVVSIKHVLASAMDLSDRQAEKLAAVLSNHGLTV